MYHYGKPAFLLSDRGTQFTSDFFDAVCNTLGISQAFTSAYHPQTNGQVERFNRTLLASLKCYCSEHGRDWDKFMHGVAYGYNCTVHRATGYTPFDLMLTYPPPHLALAKSETVDHEDLTAGMVKKKMLIRLRHLMNTSSKNLAKAQARYKNNFDERVRPSRHVYAPGDLVFVRREANPSGMPDHKLRTEVTDPVPIKHVDHEGRYVRVTLRDGSESTVSFDRLSPLPPRLVPDAHVPVPPVPPAPSPEPADQPDLPALRPTEPVTPRRRRRSPRFNLVEPDINALERDAMDPALFKRSHVVSYDPQRERYRVRWTGLPPQADTYEFAQYMPRSLVQSYRRSRFLPPLANSTWR